MSKREDSSKYYLVDVTYQGGAYDDDHRFSMMMPGEEVVKAWPWNVTGEEDGSLWMGIDGLTKGYGYTLMELSISREVTKAEYEKFRDKLDSVCSEKLRKGYWDPEEMEDDDIRWYRKTRHLTGEYYLVSTHFRPAGNTVKSEYTFQMMLKDEEMEAWKKSKPWRLTNDTDIYYKYEKDYPYVRVICEVTKEEYKKFHKHLNGFKKQEVMDRINEVLVSGE